VLNTSEMQFKCIMEFDFWQRLYKNAGRRGFGSLRARRFAYSSVKWNRCAAKSASLMASSLSAVWQASAAISLSMSGKAARRFAAVLRRSALWYRQIRFSSSTVKYIPHTSIHSSEYYYNSFFRIIQSYAFYIGTSFGSA